VKVISPKSSRSSPALVAFSLPPRPVATDDADGRGPRGGASSDVTANAGAGSESVRRDSSIDEGG
jgi:hypothetical protein